VAEDHLVVRAPEPVVAEVVGQPGPLVHAVAGVQVRAADAAAQDAQAHLPLLGRRLGPLLDAQLGVLGDHGSHAADSGTCAPRRGAP
jgi:hypothetical protein